VALALLLFSGALVEEVAKSVGIGVLLQHRHIASAKAVVTLSALSALGFLVGEKLLLFVSLRIVSESALSAALFGAGMLWLPLVAHFVFTAVVGLLTRRLGMRRYGYAVLAGAAIHMLYNLAVMGVLLP
jgi:hypothetical protein